MKAATNSDKFMATVKVGPKGQIVIPKEVRNMFAIEPGDSLVILADARRGIAIERRSFLNRVADAIFAGRGKDEYPDWTDEHSEVFATEIIKLEDE